MKAALATTGLAACAHVGEGASQASRPNVLWLFTDEQRTDSLGCYGSPWARSPAIDRLAREGVAFQRAVTPAPVCGPARLSHFTGQYPTQTGVWHNMTQALPEAEHLTALFEAAGYQTAGIGRNHFMSSNPPFQTVWNKHLSDQVSWFSYAEGYDEAEYDVVKYPGEPYKWIFGGRFPGPVEDTSEWQTIEEGKKWLRGRDAGAPFFLRLAFNAPHTPVSVPPPFDDCILEDAVQYPADVEAPSPAEPSWIRDGLRRSADARLMSPEQIRKARRYYYGFTAFVDWVIGSMLEWMEGEGLLDNTIVVFAADHGTHIGDFGLVQKQTFYEPSVCVPYVFWRRDGFARDVRLTTPVETRSLLPTLLGLAGIAQPEATAGLSLARCLREGVEPPADPVFSMFTLGSFPELEHDDPLMMVREGSLKLSVRFAPEPMDLVLTDLDADPSERENRADQSAYRDALDRLLAMAVARMETAGR